MLDLALDGKVFIENKVDAALQELDMLFNTEKTELINNPNYGTNFEQFLWRLNPSFQQIEQYINEQIANTFFLRDMKHNVNVQMLEGDYRYIYLVQISVEDENGVNGIREYEFR